MTEKTFKYCAGCDRNYPRTAEFFYLKRKAGRFVPSSRCKPCSVKRALDRYYASEKFSRSQERKALLEQRRLAEIESRKRRADGRLEKARHTLSPAYRLRLGMLTRLRGYRARGGLHPEIKADNAIGCSWEELADYIEARWYDGMSWSNYGSWHIDHIVPISSADLTNRDEALRVLNFKNLQPLWAHENVKKGARIAVQSSE
jgi:hypothetical protein